MSTSEDHEGLANELEREADALKRENEKLSQDIADAKDDWQSKRNDPSVPGAPAPPEREEDDGDDERQRSESDPGPEAKSDPDSA
jgi:hypothetical protein